MTAAEVMELVTLLRPLGVQRFDIGEKHASIEFFAPPEPVPAAPAAVPIVKPPTTVEVEGIQVDPDLIAHEVGG